MIKVNDLKKSYSGVEVLKGINLELEDKSQSVILGSSGSGKSTLLYMIGGLETPSSGTISVNGRNYSELSDSELSEFRNEQIGFVFQFHFLLSSLTCEQNILLPVKIAGRKKRKFVELTEMLAKYLGVSHCLKKYPYQISGGEQQRVNIIRALILKPKLLLCDEPTGNLDSKNSEKVIGLLKELANELGSTLVVVTHDLRIASQFPYKITIEDGQLIS